MASNTKFLTVPSGTVPPLKVLRQVYPKYPVAHTTLLRGQDENVLSGQTHGAYITWGKESGDLTSFSPRDYTERLVRDHSLKLRSIAFVGPDGKKRSAQAFGDAFLAVATGSSGCPNVVDTIRVQAYVNDDRDRAVWDALTETGPDTLEFRGELPALRSLLSAMDTATAKQITLFDPKRLRGTSLRLRAN